MYLNFTGDLLEVLLRLEAYLIIVTDATDGVSVNFLGRCKFLQIERKKLAFSTDFTRKSGVFYRFNAKNWRFSV